MFAKLMPRARNKQLCDLCEIYYVIRMIYYIKAADMD